MKALEWFDRVPGIAYADTIVGTYKVNDYGVWWLADGATKTRPTKTAAMAAAQADYAARILSALEPAPTAEYWRDISSAPKDGTAFLAASGTWLTVCSWNKHRQDWCCSAPGYPPYPRDETPTRWMLLPTAPLQANGDRNG